MNGMIAYYVIVLEIRLLYYNHICDEELIEKHVAVKTKIINRSNRVG